MYEQLRPNIDGEGGDEGETDDQIETRGGNAAGRTASTYTQTV